MLAAVATADLENMIRELLNQNIKLMKENLYYKNIENNLTVQTHGEAHFDIHEASPYTVETYLELIPSLKAVMSLTITFDPMRFDKLELSTEESQKAYILNSLYHVRNKLNYIFGVFEKHKSGIIHAHIACIIPEFEMKDEIHAELTRSFSSRPRNKHAVDFEKAHNPVKWVDYIIDGGKDKYGFFTYKQEDCAA